ncbi:hypothetical protein IFO70_03030 [Phormidium tenue FACHB-886]|nr:hypothetical protein [Phormidium tenue FACHB-886]
MNKRFWQLSLVLFSLYLLYLAKSALGINLSHRYSAWGILKLPIQPILDHRHS